MTKLRKQLLKLVPDAAAIALAYGVDQARSLKIQLGTRRMFESFADLIEDQAELVEGQAKTAKLIDKQAAKAQDESKIKRDVLRFLSGDPAQVEQVTDMIFTPFWKSEFDRLEHEVKIKLFAALTEAINTLDKEPDK